MDALEQLVAGWRLAMIGDPEQESIGAQLARVHDVLSVLPDGVSQPTLSLIAELVVIVSNSYNTGYAAGLKDGGNQGQ